MSENTYINSELLITRLKALIKTEKSTIEIKNKLLPMIDNLKTESKSITTDDVMIYLKPYIEENINLHKLLHTQNERIKQLEKMCHDKTIEISRLKSSHKDSGLKRDIDSPCLYVIQDITSGQLAGQKITEWFCPVCFARVSNWEPYCCHCGQKLNRIYDRQYERVSKEGQLQEKGE